MASASDVLSQPAVRRYLAAMALSTVGLQIVVAVMFWQVFHITKNELDIGWIGLAQFVPALMLVLVSGWLADRFDRRLITVLALVGRAGCGFALMLFSFGNPTHVWPMFVIAALMGVVDAIMQPSRRAIPPLISSSEDLPQVIALWTATFTGSAIVGPIIGGLLISIGPGVAYGVGSGLELAGIVPLMAVRYVRQPTRLTDRPTLSLALQGLTFIARTPLVLAAISLDLLAVLFGGAVALIAPVASQRLGLGDFGYGILRAAPGVGAALMALYLAWRPLRRRIGSTLLVAVATFGLGTVVFGITRSPTVAFVALAILSAADMVSMFIRGSMVPLATPDHQLGRVTAVEGVFIGASNELGAFESGVTARLFGTSPAIVFGGVMTIIVAASFAFLFPSVRRLDRFDELQGHRDGRDGDVDDGNMDDGNMDGGDVGDGHAGEVVGHDAG